MLSHRLIPGNVERVVGLAVRRAFAKRLKKFRHLVIDDGVVYVNSLNSLYALDEATGSILWRASVYIDFYVSPVVADGIVYIGSTDGNLYAFSVNGVFPASRLPGGELGVKPAISSL